MIKYIFSFLILFSTLACTNVQRKNIDEYYVPSGTAKYILPEISRWYNFSEAGQCFRQEVVKGLQFDQLKNSFGIDYERAVQLQIGFNLERQRLVSQSRVSVLPVKDEERVFFTSSDKVQSNVDYFRVPKYDRIHLIWIDLAISKPAYLQKLVQFSKSNKMDEGFPVFLSLCLSSTKTAEFVKKHMRISTFRTLGFEALNQFNAKSERIPRILIDFKEIFGMKKKLYFYSPNGVIPREYVGKFRKL